VALAPDAADWLARSASALSGDFPWARFLGAAPGHYPLTSSPCGELAWEFVARPDGFGLRLGWERGGCDIPLTAGPLAEFSCDLTKGLSAVLSVARTAAAAVHPDAAGWPSHQMFEQVIADGWPVALRVPLTGTETITVGEVLERALVALTTGAGWEAASRTVRLEPGALRLLLTWEARYNPRVLGRGFILNSARSNGRDVTTGFQLGADLFGCDPLFVSLDPVSVPTALSPPSAPPPGLSETWYAAAGRRGLIGGSVTTRRGCFPVPTPCDQVSIREMLLPDGLTCRRFPERLRALLVRAAAELVNWPDAPDGGWLQRVQRAALLVWDIDPNDPVSRFARRCRESALFGSEESAPVCREAANG
jgi:hypothetical protein